MRRHGLILFAVLAAGAAQAQLVSFSGELRAIDEPPFVTIGSAEIGTFSLESAGADDLRTTPGTATLTTPGGSLTASAVRVNEVRRVDPATGRLVEVDAAAGATCPTGAEADCWEPGDPIAGNADAFDAIDGFTAGGIDPQAGFLTVWNSPLLPAPALAPTLTVAVALTNLLAGDPTGIVFLGLSGVPGGFVPPLAGLNADPLDPFTLGITNPSGIVLWGAFAIENVTTPEQKGVLGCNEFLQTSCDGDGIGLLQTELSALASAWIPVTPPGFHDPTAGAPGTIGTPFDGICRREGWILPGCRGPEDAGYDSSLDGTAPSLGSGPFAMGNDHPFTGEAWRSEIAAISWNFQVALAGLSSDFDPSDPFATDGCSLARPQLCQVSRSFRSVTTRELSDDPSGDPAWRWVWETGAEYLVTEATGDLADFDGWTLHAFGPEESRVEGADAGVVFFLVPPNGVLSAPANDLGFERALPAGGTAVIGAAYGVQYDGMACGLGAELLGALGLLLALRLWSP